jgi:hypothetical protein
VAPPRPRSNLGTLRVSEGMLAILLAGGIDPQTGAIGLMIDGLPGSRDNR